MIKMFDGVEYDEDQEQGEFAINKDFYHDETMNTNLLVKQYTRKFLRYLEVDCK